MSLVSQRKRYCCSANDRYDLESYYVNQAGSGIGSVFAGSRTQVGHGFGSFMGGLFRKAVPYLKRIGTSVLKGGAQVASDMLAGKPFNESARARTKEGIDTYLDQQTGSGLVKRRKTYKRKRNNIQDLHMSKKKKRSIKRETDIFT